jgi:membrane protein
MELARRLRKYSLSADATQPQPEAGATDLSMRNYGAILVRAGRASLKDEITSLAAALAYYAFLAIPSLLLVAVGIFGLVAGPGAITNIVDRLEGVVPAEAVTLIESSLERVTQQQSGAGISMIVVGGVLALWSLTGAMQTLMWALNIVHDRDETRGFAKRRLTALAMVVLMLTAFALAFGLLVLGPHLSGWLGSTLEAEDVVRWIWWTAQWPILILGLTIAFATILYLGPNVEHRHWRFLSFGTGFAVVVWLLASGAFSVFLSRFGNYDKTWGSLAAVIVMLTWLWLSGLSLLFGAEINAEAERSREQRRGEQDEVELHVLRKS